MATRRRIHLGSIFICFCISILMEPSIAPCWAPSNCIGAVQMELRAYSPAGVPTNSTASISFQLPISA